MNKAAKKVQKDLISLLEFFSNHQTFEEHESFYQTLDQFLSLNCASRPMVVFSYPRLLSNDSNTARCRIMWNKHSIDDENYLNEMGTAIGRKMRGKSRKEIYVEGDKYFFYLGEDDTQKYYAAFASKRSLDKDYLHYLTQYSKTCFENIERMVRLRSSNALIYIDDVTGLFNQRKLLKDLDYCIARYNEYEEFFVVLFIDIDHFKNVNDGHGHLIGTKLLLELGVILRQTLRESDLIYRYGGDEFVIIVPKANTIDGKMIGERLLNAVKNNEFLKGYDGPHSFHLSVSIGISTYPQDARTRQEILSTADQMMYQAKRSGRGQVCMASEFFRR